MTTLLEVRQDSLTSLGDGNTPPAALLRMGLPATASKWDLFALQGRMFNAKQAAIGTAIAGSAADAGGIVLTAPTIRFTVPTGTTVFPRRFNWAYATAAGTLNEIAVAYTNTNSYTSGGTAYTPTNWRTDNPIASVVTNAAYAAGSAIVEASLGTVRAIYQDMLPIAFADAADITQYRFNVVWDDLIPIIGPASFLIWVSAATTAGSGYFCLDWAEVPTVAAVTAV